MFRFREKATMCAHDTGQDCKKIITWASKTGAMLITENGQTHDVGPCGHLQVDLDDKPKLFRLANAAGYVVAELLIKPAALENFKLRLIRAGQYGSPHLIEWASHDCENLSLMYGPKRMRLEEACGTCVLPVLLFHREVILTGTCLRTGRIKKQTMLID